MKKVLSQKQLENMIAECVGQVITEARQSKKPARKLMNEAQLHEYIQNIINEEMEDEGWGSALMNGIKNSAKSLVGKGNGKSFTQNVTNGYVGGDIMDAAKILEKQKDYLVQSGMQDVDFVIKTLYRIAQGATQNGEFNQLRNQRGQYGKRYNVNAGSTNSKLSKMKQSFDNKFYGEPGAQRVGDGMASRDRGDINDRYIMGRE